MKCDNCGAALEVVKGRSYFHCPYCTTLHFPTDVASSGDGVTPLGHQFDLTCPVCNVHLADGAVEGRSVHYCHKCRGVLVSNDDFVHIVRARRAKHHGPPDPPVPLDREELKRTVACPQCQSAMDVHPYYGPGAVVIDSCGRCKLVWLDHGEIAAIQTAPGRR